MSETVDIIPKPKTRLKFIDMARSIAILLMLEGHFIEHTFSDFKPMVDTVRTNGTSGNLIFDWWYFMKGFTAPMFFTVTGLVFVYLLARNKDAGYTRNPRVRKGFKRVLELLFWGYMLQISFRNIGAYFRGYIGDWVYAFHVLQSIGIGIAALLLIYGLYLLFSKIPLFIYYFIFATLIFSFYPYFKTLGDGEYLPHGAPQIIQNIFRGPSSVFPIIPWMAFTLYGGMVGAILIQYQKYVKKNWFPATFILLGIAFNAYGRTIFGSVDKVLSCVSIEGVDFIENAWLYGRLGQIFIALGILMLIEKYFDPKAELFLKIGQNTLPIYVIHVVILYGGIFGYGLNHVMYHTLSGWQSVLGAAIFIGAFVVFIKYFEWFDEIWTKFWSIFKWWKPKKENL